jgi:UDP-N-acetylglucosamine--N-acetylmuramyl-(pentapeptide) pyrophosphoryl-undecaprenol N-acetylglucosamine transferase
LKYILTGGGTGGHVYPALAIAEQIKKNESDAKFLYLGTKDHIEAKIVPAKGYKMKFIRSTGMPSGKFSFAMLNFVFSIFTGTLKSLFIILFYRPDMIIGSGGFVSAPPIFAGHILRKLKLSKTKMFLHEANAEAGKLVKKAGPMCDGVGVSYAVALSMFKSNGRFVGYPVRPEFFYGSKAESRKKLGLPEDKFIVFAVGGSQGARTINRAVIDSIRHLSDINDLLLIHVTGRGNNDYNGFLDTIKRIEKNGLKDSDLLSYKKMEYAENIKDYYFAADLIITRGGGTVNEIAVCGTPSLIIPKANLSGDHQVMNALSMKESGASEIIYEEVIVEDGKFLIKVDGAKLAEKIKELYSDKERLAKMSSASKISVIAKANEEIYNFIKDIFSGAKISRPAENAAVKNRFADMSAAQILSALSKMKKCEIAECEYIDYIKYRASHYLVSPDWNTRNSAVKICGLTGDLSKIPFMSRLLSTDKIGFVRRNILSAYRQIGVYNEAVEKDLFTALSDSYWEVRVEALICIKYFEEETKLNDKLCIAVKNIMATGNFEEVHNAIKAYSVYINSENDMAELVKFYYTDNVLIREEILNVMGQMRDKAIFSEKFINGEISKMLLTTTGFVPNFRIKNIIKNVACK